MSLIDIHALHQLDLDHAQQAADDLASDLAEKFSIDYGWEDDVIHFERTGVQGSITVRENEIHIQAELGLLLMLMQSGIEAEIRRYLKNHFGCTFRD